MWVRGGGVEGSSGLLLSMWAQVHQLKGGTCVRFDKEPMLQWGHSC